MAQISTHSPNPELYVLYPHSILSTELSHSEKIKEKEAVYLGAQSQTEIKLELIKQPGTGPK